MQKAWKADSLRGFMSAREQELAAKQQRQSDQKEIKQLKHELREKEKALAETAALLACEKSYMRFGKQKTRTINAYSTTDTIRGMDLGS